MVALKELVDCVSIHPLINPVSVLADVSAENESDIGKFPQATEDEFRAAVAVAAFGWLEFAFRIEVGVGQNDGIVVRVLFSRGLPLPPVPSSRSPRCLLPFNSVTPN